MKNFKQEIILSVLLLLALFFIINPAMILMPNQLQMFLIVIFIAIFLGFSILIWKERGGDERDVAHRLFADRVGFLLGSLVLFIGVLFGVLSHSVDLWLVGALSIMVLAKIGGLVYLKIKN